jgi:ribose/xylose/arabinose/galactoside ABC-type transport system permease subunit
MNPVPNPFTRSLIRLVLAAVALAAIVATTSGLRAGPSVAASAGSSIIATYGVGGVLKGDGRLYQWRPEKKQWVTIDESFRLDGETRKVLPLPVSATEVSRMEGFGFLVTRSGTCWLYNLDTNRWENVGRP